MPAESSPTRNRGRQTDRRRHEPFAFLPGRLLVTVSIPPTDQPEESQARLRRVAAELLADLDLPVGAPPDRKSDAPIVFSGTRSQLLTVTLALPVDDTKNDTVRVRRAVDRLNSDAGRRALEAERLVLVGATPNWFSAAQQDCVGGSPGSDPAPTRPGGGRVRYYPESTALDTVQAAAASTWAKAGGPDGVAHIAILDTVPGGDLSRRAADFPDNHHFEDVVHRLAPPIGRLRDNALEQLRFDALAEVDRGAFYPASARNQALDVRDHGLFVASAIHAVAPWATLRLVRVLNDFGIGTLEIVLTALAGLLREKRPDSPLVINLSLGLLPPIEQLPALWFAPQDQPGGSRRAIDRVSVEHDIRVLERPVQRLVQHLVESNCLIVAAAGNDSLDSERAGRSRFEPRVPARFDTVLGVAATARATRPAAYSNRGDVPVLGNAIATLGGDVAADGVRPRAGVVGTYSAQAFPPSAVPNKTGWAEWSGTSFASALTSGVAANVWADRLEHASPDATTLLDIINDAVRLGGTPDVAGLRVPPVGMRREWIP